METYHAYFEFEHGLRLNMRMFDHHEHQWIWTHRYVQRPDGRRTQPEVVNDMRILAVYIDGALKLPLKVSMEIVFPKLRGKQFLAGVDISPGSKTYIEFHYGDPDDEQALRLMRIEVGAFRFVDIPRVPVSDNALVLGIDFPFPVLDRLPLTYGLYRVPFMAEGQFEARNGVVEWPTIDVRAAIGNKNSTQIVES